MIDKENCGSAEDIHFFRTNEDVRDLMSMEAEINEFVSHALQETATLIDTVCYTEKMNCIHRINELAIKETADWVTKGLNMLQEAYEGIRQVYQGAPSYESCIQVSESLETLQEIFIRRLKKAHRSTFGTTALFQDQATATKSIIQGSFIAYKAKIKFELEQQWKDYAELYHEIVKTLGESCKIKKLKDSYHPTKNTRHCPIVTSPLGKTPLLDRDFFPDPSLIQYDRVFPVMVLATMSSGKSTLINALLGTDVLPSQNKACTAKVYSILDDDTAINPTLYIMYKNGKKQKYTSELEQNIAQANSNDEVEHILIINQILEVVNSTRSLLLIDTPGPNNSADRYHAEIANKVLRKIHGGVLIYLINATQIGISDDQAFLQIVRDYAKNHPAIKILVAINKIDELDLEKESIDSIVISVRKYLAENGLSNLDIVPISALAAKLLRQVLSGKKDFSRLQENQINTFLDYFCCDKPPLNAYAWFSDGQNPFEEITPFHYTVAQIKYALECTGIPLVEQYIQRAQILCDTNGT